MPELLLIDVVLCAVLITLAALIVVGHWRRSRAQSSLDAEERPGAAAELAGEETATGETAVLPGFSADTARPDPGADAPAEPEQAPQSAADAPAAPQPAADAPAEPEQVSQPAADVPAEPGQTVEPQVSAVTGPEPGANGQSPPSNGQGLSPNGQPASADAVAESDPIGSFYDEADRAMSDYLAALGWTGEPTAHDLRRSSG